MAYMNALFIILPFLAGLVFIGVIVAFGVAVIAATAPGCSHVYGKQCNCKILDLNFPENLTFVFQACPYSLSDFNDADTQKELDAEHGCKRCGPLPFGAVIGNYTSGPTGPTYTESFVGKCDKSGLRMYEGDDNPGKTHIARAEACAKSCSRRKSPLNDGSWNSFMLKGFAIKDDGRCYCKDSSSARCDRQTWGKYTKYVRYDFVGELAQLHPTGDCSCKVKPIDLSDTDDWDGGDGDGGDGRRLI